MLLYYLKQIDWNIGKFFVLCKINELSIQEPANQEARAGIKPKSWDYTG
jgi:hypothetical protein